MRLFKNSFLFVYIIQFEEKRHVKEEDKNQRRKLTQPQGKMGSLRK